MKKSVASDWTGFGKRACRSALQAAVLAKVSLKVSEKSISFPKKQFFLFVLYGSVTSENALYCAVFVWLLYIC